MHDNQPQVQTGDPGGGQRGTPSHAEPQVPLFDRMDGSFFHPSPFRTAENCIRFWSSIEIPDAIIDQFLDDFHAAQVKKVDEEMRRYMHAWESEWLARNPKPATAEIPAWEAKYTPEREEYRLAILPGVQDANPSALGRYDIPQLIRAAQIWTHAPNARFGDEQDKVGSHSVELFEGSMTVDEIEAKYQFSRFQESLRKVRVNDPTEKLLAVLNSIDAGVSEIPMQIAEFLSAAPDESTY